MMKKPTIFILLTTLIAVANSVPDTIIQKKTQSIQGGNSNSMNQNIGQSFIVNSNKFNSDDAADLAEILMEERPNTEHNHKKPKAKKVPLPKVPNLNDVAKVPNVPNVGLPLPGSDTNSSLPSLSGLSGNKLPLNMDSPGESLPSLPGLDNPTALIG